MRKVWFFNKARTVTHTQNCKRKYIIYILRKGISYHIKIRPVTRGLMEEKRKRDCKTEGSKCFI